MRVKDGKLSGNRSWWTWMRRSGETCEKSRRTFWDKTLVIWGAVWWNFLMCLLLTPLTRYFSAPCNYFQSNIKKISEFLTIITKDSFGRQLFQLALAMSCKRLLGDAFEQLVAIEVQKQVPSAVVECLNETPTRPSEGLLNWTLIIVKQRTHSTQKLAKIWML